MEDLKSKSCVPCQGGEPPLAKDAAATLLNQLGNDWQINDTGHLYKSFKFKDFRAAMAFANQITEIAEEQGHHPDLMIGWGRCAVEIWTHKINGLSESDFILGAKIEAIE